MRTATGADVSSPAPGGNALQGFQHLTPTGKKKKLVLFITSYSPIIFFTPVRNDKSLDGTDNTNDLE